MQPAIDERLVDAAQPFDLGGHGQSQHNVASRRHRQMQISLFGDLDAFGINDNQLGAVLSGLLDDRGEMQVGYGDVIAPDDDQF